MDRIFSFFLSIPKDARKGRFPPFRFVSMEFRLCGPVSALFLRVLDLTDFWDTFRVIIFLIRNCCFQVIVTPKQQLFNTQFVVPPLKKGNFFSKLCGKNDDWWQKFAFSETYSYLCIICDEKRVQGGGQKKLHAQKKYHEIVSIVLWLKEYFKGFFFLTEY